MSYWLRELLIRLAFVAAMLAALAVHAMSARAEPHADMPAGWTLEAAPDDAPAATLEQDDACASTN